MSHIQLVKINLLLTFSQVVCGTVGISIDNISLAIIIYGDVDCKKKRCGFLPTLKRWGIHCEEFDDWLRSSIA